MLFFFWTLSANAAVFLRDLPVYKFRASTYQAKTKYFSASNETLGSSGFDYLSTGANYEVETIFDRDPLNSGSVRGFSSSSMSGLIAHYEKIESGSVLDSPIELIRAGAYLSWWPVGIPRRYGVRVIGGSKATDSEFVFYIGPEYQKFSEIRSSAIANQVVSVVKPELLGLTVGARFCLAFTRDTCLELSAYYVVPAIPLGSLISSLDRNRTRTIGGSIMLDFKLDNYFGVAAGVIQSSYFLRYSVRTNIWQEVQVTNIGPALNAQMRF